MTIQERLRSFKFDKDNMPRMTSETRVPVGLASEAADTIDELVEALEKSEYIIMEYHNRYKFEHRDDYTYRNPASEAIAKAKGKYR